MKNYGLNPETFIAFFTVGSVHNEIKCTTLQPNETDTLTFSEWHASPEETFYAKVKTLLPNDEDLRNDSLLSKITISSGLGPEIYSITPIHGGNKGSVTVEILGKRFKPGEIVKPTRPFQNSIKSRMEHRWLPRAEWVRCFNGSATTDRPYHIDKGAGR